MSASAASFLLPDTEPSWRLWRSLASTKAEPVSSPAEFREQSRPIVVGLPATACRTIGLMLPTVDTTLLPSMVEAQLERRGIHVEKTPTPNFAWHLLGQSQGQSFVSVDVLAHPFPGDLAVPHAVNYTAALRLVTLPANNLCIVEELGLLVLVANFQGRLWHSHVTGFAEMPVQDLARELDLARLTLESQEGFGVVRGVTLAGERPAALATELRKYISMPIEVAGPPGANRGLDLKALPKLLPVSVFTAQANRESRRRLVSVGMLTMVLYAILFALGWWHLQSLKAEAADLEARASGLREPAERVRTSFERWRALEPAVEKQRYPMMQLSHVTSIMPPSGIVIKRFSAKPTEIELRGDARDLQTAAQFLEDLKKHPKLDRFHWEMPTPDIKNKIASFRITGKMDSGT
ncbi:hypothetical protein [Roseimicrobium sp. ORNL1]|uniref:hypothetical protein n=1 Tax=Roseimicrobium sp. ORNL1 TaxID=2711231 RepID=UPI0013E10E1D|nr:hypothetical protein [Roseimicrobium sp. ORNL1]QIF02238.1 hypothetical protein G5S37_12095 [Roseimicrobium sp. ORNL1]